MNNAMNPRPRSSVATLVGFALLCFALVAPRTAHAVGEVNGRLKGVVLEAASQAPVPGAQVKIQGKNLIGNARVVTTGDDGSFEVFELPAGPYTVEISYQGVKPIVKHIVIRQGEAFPLDVQWSAELAEQETTVVTEERRMTRPDDSSTGTVLTQDQISKVATTRDYQGVVTQVASVNDTEGDGNVSIKGATELQTRYMVDGLDITDPVTGTFSANINFDSIASIEVLTGAMDAEYNSLGGVINITSAGGSDEWNVIARLFVNNQHFSAGQNYGSGLAQGVQLFSNQPKPINQSYQAVLGVGGPIVKHRLWFNLNVEYDYNESQNTPAPPLNLALAPFKSNGALIRGKLIWAPNDKHRLSLSISGDPLVFDNENQNPGGLPNTESGRIQGGTFVTLLYNYFISDKYQFDIHTGFQFQRIYDGPEGIIRGGAGHVANPYSMAANTYNPNAAQHDNLTDNSVWYQGGEVVDDRRMTFQFDPSFSLRGKAFGSHDAKIGVQTRLTRWTNTAYQPGVSIYEDAGGGPLEAGLCNIGTNGVPTSPSGCFERVDVAPTNVSAEGAAVGLFLRDRWTLPWKRLILEPGIRFDWGATRNGLGQTVANLFGIGPRLGAIVDITGDQKTMFKANYGRSNEVMSLLAPANANPTGIEKFYQYNPASNSFQSVGQLGGPNGYRTDPYGNTPHVDQVTVTINREVFKNSLVQVDYTYKHFANQWDSAEINQVWDPTGTRVVGYKNGQAEQVFRYDRPGKSWRDYQGIDFSLESRPNEHWDLYAAYTLAWLYGPAQDEFGQIAANQSQSQFYNPRFYNTYDGYAPEDIRHSIKLRASYNWKGLTIGTFLNWHSGVPLTHLFFNAADSAFGNYTTRRGPSGTDSGSTATGSNPNDVHNITEFRTPDVLTCDLRASYSLKALTKQDIAIIFDFFNLFNLGTTTGIRTIDTSNFGLSTGHLTPFRMQLGLSYNYN